MPGPEPSDGDIEILRVISRRYEPFASASDVEPELSVGYKQTRNRMDDLAEEGLLNKRKVGTVNLYWLSDEGRMLLATKAD